MIEFVGKDEKGYKRYWRTPPSEEERRLAEARLREERKREQGRKKAELRGRRDLLERFEKTSRNRINASNSRESAGSSLDALYDTSTPKVELSKEGRVARDSARKRWLLSKERERLVRDVGWRLGNVLERDEYQDRAILAHPGEWKSLLFRMFVHGMEPGRSLDLETLVSITVQEFPHTDEELVGRAVGGFLSSLVAKGAGLRLIQNGGFVTIDLPDFWRSGQPGDTGGI